MNDANIIDKLLRDNDTITASVYDWLIYYYIKSKFFPALTTTCTRECLFTYFVAFNTFLHFWMQGLQISTCKMVTTACIWMSNKSIVWRDVNATEMELYKDIRYL